jgi:hypothetical protein
MELSEIPGRGRNPDSLWGTGTEGPKGAGATRGAVGGSRTRYAHLTGSGHRGYNALPLRQRPSHASALWPHGDDGVLSEALACVSEPKLLADPHDLWRLPCSLAVGGSIPLLRRRLSTRLWRCSARIVVHEHIDSHASKENKHKHRRCDPHYAHFAFFGVRVRHRFLRELWPRRLEPPRPSWTYRRSLALEITVICHTSRLANGVPPAGAA